jgi:hypothetical protein
MTFQRVAQFVSGPNLVGIKRVTVYFAAPETSAELRWVRKPLPMQSTLIMTLTALAVIITDRGCGYHSWKSRHDRPRRLRRSEICLL